MPYTIAEHFRRDQASRDELDNQVELLEMAIDSLRSVKAAVEESDDLDSSVSRSDEDLEYDLNEALEQLLGVTLDIAELLNGAAKHQTAREISDLTVLDKAASQEKRVRLENIQAVLEEAFTFKLKRTMADATLAAAEMDVEPSFQRDWARKLVERGRRKLEKAAGRERAKKQS